MTKPIRKSTTTRGLVKKLHRAIKCKQVSLVHVLLEEFPELVEVKHFRTGADGEQLGTTMKAGPLIQQVVVAAVRKILLQ